MNAPESHGFRGHSRLLGQLMELVRRVLNYRVSVAALLEVALWLAIPYICLGLVWAFFHPDGIERLQTQAERQFHLPAGSLYEVAAVAEVTLLWPVVLLLPSDACTR